MTGARFFHDGVDDLDFVGATTPDILFTRPTRKPKVGTLAEAQKTATITRITVFATTPRAESLYSCRRYNNI